VRGVGHGAPPSLAPLRRACRGAFAAVHARERPLDEVVDGPAHAQVAGAQRDAGHQLRIALEGDLDGDAQGLGQRARERLALRAVGSKAVAT
jgi:phytoene/squalene synthetase